ncbi:hypothetical protein [Microbacterium sp. No. 7]|uniref:hypothetical protein n=1 Tax=Microbacterium sp. No. 7 TaxID=1714373 RepID=UPI0006D29104|nr:hypothetical protein [Microbacterium sp. No. 7]ALJ21654.1 hypothetical protein AOA12_17855 [Microbacterium sp. No. 7]
MRPLRRALARVAVLATAALAGVLLLTVPAAAADAPPAPEVSSFTDETAGGVTLQQQGSRVTVPVALPRVYPYVYAGSAEPVGVGWLEPDGGVVRIDLALMPPGDIVVALLAEDGSLAGWAGTALAEADSHAPPPDAAASADDTESASPGVTGSAWPFVVGGIAVLAVATVAVLIGRRRRRDAGTDGAEPNGP